MVSDAGLVEASSRSLELSQLRYGRGSDTDISALTIQVALHSARQSLIAVRPTPDAQSRDSIPDPLRGDALTSPLSAGGFVRIAPARM